MRRRVGLLAGALPALALWWSGAIYGQDAATTDASAKPVPETIAQADIPTRADADERFARDVIQRSTGRDPTEKFGPRLDALGESVREQSQLFKRDELKLLSVRRLESLERHWKFYGKQLEAWRRDLQQATGQYAEDAAELARRRAVWEATRKAAETTTIAPALGNRIDFVAAQTGAGRAGDLRPDRQADQAEPARERGGREHRGRPEGHRGGDRLHRQPADPARLAADLGALARRARVRRRIALAAGGPRRREAIPGRVLRGQSERAAPVPCLPDRHAAVAALAQLPQPQAGVRRSRDSGFDARAAPADFVVAGARFARDAGFQARRADPGPRGRVAARADSSVAVAAAVRLRGARSLALCRDRAVPARAPELPVHRQRAVPPRLLVVPDADDAGAARLVAVAIARAGRRRSARRAGEGPAGGGILRYRGDAGLGPVERVRQRLAGRDADGRADRQRLRWARAVCGRHGALVRDEPAARAPFRVALQDRHAARGAAAARIHQAAQAGGAGGMGGHHAERIPHLPAHRRCVEGRPQPPAQISGRSRSRLAACCCSGSRCISPSGSRRPCA